MNSSVIFLVEFHNNTPLRSSFFYCINNVFQPLFFWNAIKNEFIDEMPLPYEWILVCWVIFGKLISWLSKNVVSLNIFSVAVARSQWTQIQNKEEEEKKTQCVGYSYEDVPKRVYCIWITSIWTHLYSNVEHQSVCCLLFIFFNIMKTYNRFEHNISTTLIFINIFFSTWNRSRHIKSHCAQAKWKLILKMVRHADNDEDGIDGALLLVAIDANGRLVNK